MNKRILSKDLINILIAAMLVCSILAGIWVYMLHDGIIKFKLMEINEFSQDGKCAIEHNIVEGTYFTTKNEGYKKGDIVFVLYNIDDLFSFNLCSW